MELYARFFILFGFLALTVTCLSWDDNEESHEVINTSRDESIRADADNVAYPDHSEEMGEDKDATVETI